MATYIKKVFAVVWLSNVFEFEDNMALRYWWCSHASCVAPIGGGGGGKGGVIPGFMGEVGQWTQEHLHVGGSEVLSIWDSKYLAYFLVVEMVINKGIIFFSRKTNISYLLIRTCASAYQGARNASFSEYFTNLLTEWSLTGLNLVQERNLDLTLL